MGRLIDSAGRPMLGGAPLLDKFAPGGQKHAGFPEQAGAGLRRVMAQMSHIDPVTMSLAMSRTPEYRSASQIMRRYSPLPGDYDKYEQEITHTTGGGSATYEIGFGGHTSPGGRLRMPGDTGAHFSEYPQIHESPETEDEVWERKLSEAHDQGLYHKIESAGQVLNPIQLSTRRAPRDDSTDSAGRRVVLGGHHRLAVAADLGYHVPVLYYHGLQPRMHDPAYPYEGRSVSSQNIGDRLEDAQGWEAAQEVRNEARRQQRASRQRGVGLRAA